MRIMRASLLLAAALVVALPGCRKEDTIEQYTIEVPGREALALRVAILPRGKDVYFVRLSGPEEIIKKHEAAFAEFVKSVRFVDKGEQPSIAFTEPKGWKKDRPVAGREASYRIDADDLDVKVTKFSQELFDLVRNIQRWQKELNLAQAANLTDAEKFTKTEKLGDQPVTWVAMHGYAIPKASAPMELPTQAPRPAPIARAAGLPFKFETPKGWAAVEANDGITRARFDVDKASVTLTSLGGDGGGLGSNVNRWRKQIGLPGAPDDELAKSAVSLKIAGRDARYVDLANPSGPPAKNRILAVILPLGEETWFIRMSGPHDAVGLHKNAFETFVKSFKLDAK